MKIVIQRSKLVLFAVTPFRKRVACLFFFSVLVCRFPPTGISYGSFGSQYVFHFSADPFFPKQAPLPKQRTKKTIEKQGKGEAETEEAVPILGCSSDRIRACYTHGVQSNAGGWPGSYDCSITDPWSNYPR